MTTTTEAGIIESGVIYSICFECPGLEEGSIIGYWTGEIDSWGKLAIQSIAGPEGTHYLFPREFLELERVA